MRMHGTQEAVQKGERREYPRLEVTLPLKAINPDGKVVNVWMRNVSRAGIQFSLDRTKAERLFSHNQISPGSPIVLRFGLPSDEDPWPEIEIRTKVIYAQRIAQDAYVIGVMYTELAQEDSLKLETFIEASLRPAW